MLTEAVPSVSGRILDLGCGYGIVGIYLKLRSPDVQVTFSDVSEEAVRCTEENLKRNGITGCSVIRSNGFENIPADERFDVILSNPPYHTDFSIAKEFIEKGYRHLATGGIMFMVTKRLDWYRNKLSSVFGGVKIRERDGYYIFIAEKRAARKSMDRNKGGLSKKLERKYGKR